MLRFTKNPYLKEMDLAINISNEPGNHDKTITDSLNGSDFWLPPKHCTSRYYMGERLEADNSTSGWVVSEPVGGKAMIQFW